MIRAYQYVGERVGLHASSKRLKTRAQRAPRKRWFCNAAKPFLGRIRTYSEIEYKGMEETFERRESWEMLVRCSSDNLNVGQYINLLQGPASPGTTI